MVAPIQSDVDKSEVERRFDELQRTTNGLFTDAADRLLELFSLVIGPSISSSNNRDLLLLLNKLTLMPRNVRKDLVERHVMSHILSILVKFSKPSDYPGAASAMTLDSNRPKTEVRIALGLISKYDDELSRE